MNRESTPVAQTEYPGGDPGTRHLTDPTFLKELRVQMLKFATIQLRDEALAEDAVQEALIGALKKAASFNRRSAQMRTTSVFHRGPTMSDMSSTREYIQPFTF